MKHFSHTWKKSYPHLFTLWLIAVIGVMDLEAFSQTVVRHGNIDQLAVNQHQGNMKLLETVLIELEAEYNVSIVFDNAIINQKKVNPEVMVPNDLEKSLEGILRPLQLESKKIKKGVYVIQQVNSSTDAPKAAPLLEQKSPPQSQEEEKVLLPSVSKLHEAVLHDKTVTGNITDENNESLPGANIVVKGTTTGTISDLDGNYRLNVPNETDTLVFSSVGFETQEIPVRGRSVINVHMLPDLRALEEIVVVGYGSVKKSDLTGAVSSVSGEELEKLPVTSLEQGLQGRAAGVQVTQTDAAPGGAISIRIRGGNSITGNNEPLYVIDGYPILNEPITSTGNSGGGGSQVLKTNPMASLNPNDIASIEILKDASATAIYGSRGANGVVIITTKRGKANTSNFDVDFYTGVQEVTRTIPVLNLREYAALTNEAFITNGQEAPFPDVDQLVDSLHGGTDWQKEIFQIAPVYNTQISYTGGNDKTRYMASGNYFSQEGIVIGSQFDRIAFRFNLDSDVSDRFKLGYSLNLSYLDNDEVLVNDGGTGSAGVVHNALTAAPYLPVFDQEGNYFVDWQQIGPVFRRDNPVSLALATTNNTKIGRGLGNFYMEYEILEGLRARVSLGADVQYLKRNLYIPRTTYRGYFSNGIADVQTSQIYNWLNENTLTYAKTFNENHELNILAGYTMQRESRENVRARGEGFVNDILAHNTLESASVINPPPSTGANEWSLQSFIGRVNYGLNGKYLFTFTARADGSSRFGENNQWGFFPSGAIAWRISDESFMQNLDLFSNLKLRASYGLTGNQEIPLYRSQASLGVSTYILGDAAAIGIAPNRIANPDLKWETTSQFDIGLDFGFLDERLRFTMDYYYKKTEDLLLELTIPWTSGYSSSLQNVGSTENKGFEFSMGADIFTGDFQWTLDGNISFNRNKVLDLGDIDQFFGPEVGAPGFYSPGTGVLVREGEPVNSFFGYVTDGLFRTQSDIDNAPIHRFMELGDVRYKDIDGDGEITPDDRTILGTGMPDFIYGINNSFTYKNFDLTLFLQGVQGGKVLNVLRIYELESMRGTHNNVADAVDRWSPENPDGTMPKADYRGHENWVEDLNVEDASFFRIKNLVVGYTLPTSSLQWLRKLRVYFSAQNLLTLTNYSGFDPEVNSQGQNPINQNIDYGAYPRARVYNVGFNLGF